MPPITSDEAAEIAQEAGLNLSDAAALATLAKDKDHAKELAGRFTSQENIDSMADRIAEGMH